MRADLIAQYLSNDLPAGTDLVRVPVADGSGFTSISYVRDGDYFEYDPDRIAATTHHLSDDQLVAYLDAILDWWHFSFEQFTLQHDPSTIVHAFLADQPTDAMVIGLVASEYDVSVARWLAPNR